MTVEERLQKLEGMNQRLNEQNQQLTDRVSRGLDNPVPSSLSNSANA